MTDAIREQLALQADLLRAQMDVLTLRSQLLQRDRQDLAARLADVTARLQARQPAPTDEPPPDEATQAELARIAAAGPGDLPSLVTRRAQNDDGSPQRDAQGRVILLHQDGTPLSVIERAIVARQAELRGEAGG